jgi:hypothetical protein
VAFIGVNPLPLIPVQASEPEIGSAEQNGSEHKRDSYAS